MEKEQLISTLKELHEDLSSAEQVDDETLEHLKTLTGDIQGLLERVEKPEQPEIDSLSGRLKEAVLKFESDHPRLGMALNQVADALGNLGI